MRALEIWWALFFVVSTGLLFQQMRENKFVLAVAVGLAVISSGFTIQQIYYYFYPPVQTTHELDSQRRLDELARRAIDEQNLRLEHAKTIRELEAAKLRTEQELADLRKQEQLNKNKDFERRQAQQGDQSNSRDVERPPVQQNPPAGRLPQEEMKDLALGVFKGVIGVMLDKLEKERSR
jgi:low affinity Fe/Cu permease